MHSRCISVSIRVLVPNFNVHFTNSNWGLKGQEIAAQGLFSNLNFESPFDHVTSTKVLDDNLAAVIEVKNPTGFDNGEGLQYH